MAYAEPAPFARETPDLPSPKPIGVFDSGVGGLSVLRALRSALPNENFVYLADSGNAPYGERGDAFVIARSHAITEYLCAEHGVKALVVACNTATAAAIHSLRAAREELPLIGLEPAVKPALSITRTGRIGVMGTRGTLGSAKFALLTSSLAHGGAQFVVQPCDGLAHAIERSVDPTLASTAGGEPLAQQSTAALCQQYVQAMGSFGMAPGQIDTLVLGCTHYVFVEDELRALVGPGVRIIETGEAVARQTHRVLETHGLLRAGNSDSANGTADAMGIAGVRPAAVMGNEPRVRLLTTGSVRMLRAAAQRWLALPAECCTAVAIP